MTVDPNWDAPRAVPVEPVVVAQYVEPVVAPQYVVAPQTIATERRLRRFAPDAVVAAVVGLVLTVLGLIVLVRAGIDEPVNEPVVEVAGFAHTAWLGVVELTIGLGLLLSGAFRSRGGALFFGAILGIAGFVGAVQQESFQESLALESSLALLAVAAAVIVVGAALLIPRTITRTESVSAL